MCAKDPIPKRLQRFGDVAVTVANFCRQSNRRVSPVALPAWQSAETYRTIEGNFWANLIRDTDLDIATGAFVHPSYGFSQ
jgi:hypothetical protein